MRSISRAFAALALIAPSGRAQVTTSALADSLMARTQVFFDATHPVGLAVGVWKDGRVVLARGLGVMDLASKRPVTPQTVFHLASISKTFVATSVMQLVQAGKIRLDAPIVTYVPYFTLRDTASRRITVRQLLTHTAGMPDVDDYGWDKPQYDDRALERWIRGLKDSSSIAAPGARWEYSNIGFELLADAVAHVSGEKFEDYVRRHILDPAGMRHSTLLMTDVDSSNLATGYERGGMEWKKRPYPYNRRHAGSSTMHSSVDDMLRYGAMQAGRGTIDGHVVLSAETHAAMWSRSAEFPPQLGLANQVRFATKLPIRETYTGLGWFMYDFDGFRVAGHNGGDDGFRSALLVSADRAVVVVVLTNSSVSVPLLAYRLLDAALQPER
jgi:CubicO group peptidase (beta-lactamase class C family)